MIATHFDHVTVALDAVAPPDDDGDRDEEQVLTEQLIGVQQIGRRRGDHRDDPERRPASEAAAHDAEQQCQPGTEQGDRHQLEPVVVEAPQVDERRQDQRPAPRVADRAEPGIRVEDGEPVVGDDLAGVALEDAAGLTEIQGEVVTLGVAIAVQGDREDRHTDQPDRVADLSSQRARRAVSAGIAHTIEVGSRNPIAARMAVCEPPERALWTPSEYGDGCRRRLPTRHDGSVLDADIEERRVLVVDDEYSIVDAVSTALRYEGFTVTTASSGRSALTAVQEEAFDLVVLDVMLPDVDGFEVARRLRADGIDTPILFLTARTALDDKVQGSVSVLTIM